MLRREPRWFHLQAGHMPIEYEGVVSEHQAVRNSAGVFDVSHMGEVEIRGKDALSVVQKVTTNNAARLAINQAHYSALIYPKALLLMMFLFIVLQMITSFFA